ncbi:sensor histidine kinase [Rubellicoccus peritrichatus]|uniref:histidine kinase n=1 Tax=Rubellicoccus peritrichatus TaxID=3080537 RepID=A0AAQ3QVX1_9BACT|nr:ATP-binding protein [Puniceicoccus sp. CR14]WOO43741.1 ATP-binding protein [Puniceicoccus sp. CR14]
MLTAGIVFLLAVFTVGLFYVNASEVYKRYMHEEVRNLSLLASNLVDAEMHQQLTSPDQEGSELYQIALQPLVDFHLKMPDIHYLYTMVDIDGQDYFILDTAYVSEIRKSPDVEFSGLMELYEEPMDDSEEKATLYGGEAHVHTEPYTDEFGTFISSLAPINDSSGEMIAFVGVDYRITKYQERLASLRQAGYISLGVGIVLALILGYLAGKQHAHLKKAFEIQAAHEEELDLARRKAEAANKAKSDVMMVVAHELKTPINVIIGFCELACDFIRDKCKGEVKAELEEDLKHICVAAETLQRHTKQLLISEELDAKGVEGAVGSVLFENVLAEHIGVFDGVAKRKHITMEYDSEGSYPVLANEYAIGQAVENLFSNAVKYSPENKKIEIKLRREKDGQHLLFSVTDEGPGLSEADQKKLFQPFTRLSPQPSSGESSTGLGLSIVKRIVEAHKGKVWCESQLGQGATFFIRLPLECVREYAVRD